MFTEDNPGLRNHSVTDGGDGLLKEIRLDDIGSEIEHNERFPDGVNAEFIEILDRKEINMRVWERGSGETLACGTGACASVYAGYITGRLDAEVTVHLKGDLLIRYDDDAGCCYMTGDAEEVFTGSIDSQEA